MKECLWCKEEYEAKKDTSKFCSTSCRVMWNRKYGKKKGQVGVNELQELYDSILAAVNSINAQNGQPPALAAVIITETKKEAVLGFNELRALIESTTSEAQLQNAWEEVEKNKDLGGWQIKILKQLKEHQQTKLDF